MPERLQQLRKALIRKAKKQLQRKYAEKEVHVIRAVSVLQDLDVVFNLLAENAIEWYSAHFPELHQLLHKNEEYLQLVYFLGERNKFSEKRVSETVKEKKKAKGVAVAAKKSMGSHVGKEILDSIRLLALNALNLRQERILLEKLIEEEIVSHAPNTSQLAGPLLAAKLLAAAGGLQQLALMPSSTIQLLGAEKALFRHLRNRNVKGPKHGLLYQHPFVKSVPAKHKGKIARSVAAKLAIAAKTDFFSKEKKIAGKLQKELQQRIKQLT